MSILFVSDIHLGSAYPEISERFIHFLRQETPGVEALYILGDLFDVWIGDDAIHEEYQIVIDTLQQLTSAGLPIYLMRGNRDFLLGKQFGEMTGCQLISEPQIIDLYGTKTLLLHGDTLCTDDSEYQAFRKMVRGSEWQTKFLAMSKEERRTLAGQYRSESRKKTQLQSQEIMDVSDHAVAEVMKQYDVNQLIHGHTHRPAIHNIGNSGQGKRIVLGDWFQQKSVLRCNKDGCFLSNLEQV